MVQVGEKFNVSTFWKNQSIRLPSPSHIFVHSTMNQSTMLSTMNHVQRNYLVLVLIIQLEHHFLVTKKPISPNMFFGLNSLTTDMQVGMHVNNTKHLCSTRGTNLK